MKKTSILTGIMIVFGAMLLNAQDMKYGVKGSFLVSTFTSKDDGMYSWKPGYSIGGYFQYNLSDALGFSIEPAFAVKGANKFDAYNLYDQYSPLFWDGTAPIEYEQHDIALNIFELPVLVQLNMEVGNGSIFRVFAGPSIDFIASATMTSLRDLSTSESFVEPIESVADVTERFPYVDYGAQGGVGFDIDADPISLSIELKYRYGFSDINNVEGKPTMKSQNFGVTIGVGLEKLFQ